jgi:hypothetical protein
MALPGEIGHGNTNCMDCGEFLPLKVCMSAAGYYVGTWCDNCGPYSRESGYYRTEELAQAALDSGEFGRSTEYMPGPMTVKEVP